MRAKTSSLLAVFRKAIVVVGLAVGISTVTAVQAATATISTTSAAVYYVGKLGATSATQTLNGILYTEGQIGAMADRILLTELQIGAMADRIVYVTQLSQTNSIVAIYVLSNLTYLGLSSAGYSYSATLSQVSSLPIGW